MAKRQAKKAQPKKKTSTTRKATATKRKVARTEKVPIKRAIEPPPKGRVIKMSPDGPLFDMPNNRALRSRELKRRFIEALRECGTIKKACEMSGVRRLNYYFWTDPKYSSMYGHEYGQYYDPEFNELAQEALLGDFNDKVLETGYHRAIDGWVRRKYDRNGVLMEEEHIYDSSILQMLMKRADPKLKDKNGDVNVAVSQRNEVSVAPAAEVLDELSPGQKKLLLEAAKLKDTVIEGEVVKDD